MTIKRSGSKFKVVENVNTNKESIVKDGLTFDEARQYLAKNGKDDLFTKYYRTNHFHSGNYDLYGYECKDNVWSHLGK